MIQPAGSMQTFWTRPCVRRDAKTRSSSLVECRGCWGAWFMLGTRKHAARFVLFPPAFFFVGGGAKVGLFGGRRAGLIERCVAVWVTRVALWRLKTSFQVTLTWCSTGTFKVLYLCEIVMLYSCKCLTSRVTCLAAVLPRTDH